MRDDEIPVITQPFLREVTCYRLSNHKSDIVTANFPTYRQFGENMLLAYQQHFPILSVDNTHTNISQLINMLEC